MNSNKLFSDFDKTTTQQWEDVILKDLKGSDYNKKLITPTIEDVNIKPYYRKEQLSGLNNLNSAPNKFPFLRGNSNKPISHKIRQDFFVSDFAIANSRFLENINKGISSIGINLSNANLLSDNIELLLKGINLNNIQIIFILQHISEQFVDTLIKFLSTTSYKNYDFVLDFDPIASKTISGTFFDENYKQTIINIFNKTSKYTGLKILNIKANIFKDAGSSSVQELAFALSIANEYLLIAKENHIDIDKFVSKISFTFGIGSNYFMEIAKFRAVRLLWAKVLEAYNIKDKSKAKMNIHSVTSDWNKTAYDPYVNVLRTTTEAMSAIIGGVETLLVKPFNSSYEDSNEFSERIARNIQIILNEEAYFDKFIDPAGGSYYIESLTNSIAENAWALFLKVEDLGGYNAAFDKGFVKNEIETIANKRDLAIAFKKEILLGTNQYAAKNEKLNFEIKFSNEPNGNAIKIYRGAEAFEKLRQKTEKAEKNPKVLLLTFGNLVMRKARASFATNFFACAGFEIVENDAVTSVREGISQFEDTNADITVLCSSDDEYLEFATQIYSRIGEKTIFTIAGYPKKHIEELQKIGIENFIHVKSNILETLTKFQNIFLKK